MKNRSMLARRYAIAFVRVNWSMLDDAVMQRVDAVLHVLTNNAVAVFALKAPALRVDQQERLLAHLLTQAGLGREWVSLVNLLILSGRLFLLNSVLKNIKKLYSHRAGQQVCTVYSSHHLNDEQIATLVASIEKNIGKKLAYDVRIDPTLIAGIAVQGQTFYWEHSVRRQLQKLQEPLVHKGYYEREKY